jgi:hypothetical protein
VAQQREQQRVRAAGGVPVRSASSPLFTSQLMKLAACGRGAVSETASATSGPVSGVTAGSNTARASAGSSVSPSWVTGSSACRRRANVETSNASERPRAP